MSLVFSIFLLSAVVLLAALFEWYFRRRRRRFSARDIQKITLRWKNIEGEFTRNPHHAIVLADALVAFALKRKGYYGTMGEMLPASAHEFSHINGLWTAHKLRNRIAHDVDATISHRELVIARDTFKKALCDLGILR